MFEKYKKINGSIECILQGHCWYVGEKRKETKKDNRSELRSLIDYR